MAPLDAQASTDQAIESLKSMLAMLTRVNEELETEIAEVHEGDTAREEFVDEIDKRLVDFTHDLKTLEDDIMTEFDVRQAEDDADFATDFFERIQNLTQSYAAEVQASVSNLTDGHTALTDAHSSLMSSHEEYMQVQLETIEISGVMMDETEQTFDKLEETISHIDAEADSTIESTASVFEEAVQHIGETAVETAAEVFQTLISAISGEILETSTDAWKTLGDECRNCTADFRQLIENAADDFEVQGKGIVENLGTHVEQSLKQPLVITIRKAGEEQMEDMASEVAELQTVLAAIAMAAEVLTPFLPALRAAESVLGMFEKILETLNVGE